MERIEKQPADLILIFDVLLLLGIGLVVLFSASSYYSQKFYGDAYYYLKRQITWALLGIGLGIIVSLTPIEVIKRSTPLVVLVAFVLMIMTFIPGVSRPILGARRWIFIGKLSFQPSEFVKFAIVLYLAYIFDKKDNLEDPVNSILPPVIVVGVFLTLIYLQNDFSTAFFTLFIAASIFFIAQVRIIYFFMFGILILPLGGLLLFTKAHRVKRLIAFLNPLSDPTGAGYQVIAARSALINGGTLGVGLGLGMKKMGELPEAHSDFIFAVIGEEMGFIGVLLVVALFVVLVWRGYVIAFRCRDKFTYYLSFGVSSLIVFQAVMNMAVVSGLVPSTGVTLPFFSAGGSSLLITLIMVGILVNISKRAAKVGRRVVYG